jgi:hypothetical protein
LSGVVGEQVALEELRHVWEDRTLE